MPGSDPNKKQYSEYCKTHISEFRDELRDEATRGISGWPGRTAAILMIVSSLITFIDSTSRGNESAIFSLLGYALPVTLLLGFPFFSLFISAFSKYSPQVLDAISFTSLIGYCVTLAVVFQSASNEAELAELYLPLSGQVNFIILLSTSFSFHPRYSVTFARNLFFGLTLIIGLFVVNLDFLLTNQIQIAQGILSGTLVSWIFFETVRTRFYLKSTDADTRQHLYNQLSKLVYPHQLERIKLGDELENTMPLKEGKAIINVFDVQRSSEIRHERTGEFFVEMFQSFLQICMRGYEHNPLRSQAFRLKETGDGFISSVGYPFLPIDGRSLADSSVKTAMDMFDAFNAEVERFNYSRPIKAAMGLAYNSVQGTFQSGGIRSYDLFGDALIQASKYEELRKNPVIKGIFDRHAEILGLEYYNILIVQETVYNSLSGPYRDLFQEIDLKSSEIIDAKFEMMYDNDAKFIYFHLRD